MSLFIPELRNGSQLLKKFEGACRRGSFPLVKVNKWAEDANLNYALKYLADFDRAMPARRVASTKAVNELELEDIGGGKGKTGELRPMGAIPAEDYFMWSVVDPYYWDDPNNRKKYFEEHPESKIERKKKPYILAG